MAISRDPVFGHYTPTGEIAATLRLLFRPGDAFEIRIAGVGGRDQTEAGYFNDPDAAAKSVVARYDGRVEAIWVLLNAVPQDLLHKSTAIAFYVCTKRKGATTDALIVRRRWLLIDCDAAYPHKLGISASDAEHEQTLLLAERIYNTLLDAGWPEPMVASSGNGAHVLLPLDLLHPDELAGKRLEKLLDRLGDRFDTPHALIPCAIDRTTYNSGRLTKLYGTMACKGGNTPERPHRQAHILSVPQWLLAQVHQPEPEAAV